MNNVEKLLEKQFSVKTQYENEIKAVKAKHQNALNDLEYSIKAQIEEFITSFNSYLDSQAEKLGIDNEICDITYDVIYNLIDDDLESLFRDNEDMIFQNNNDEYDCEAYFKFGKFNKVNSYSKNYIRFSTSFGYYDTFDHDIPTDWFVDSGLWKNYIDTILKELSKHYSKKQKNEEDNEKALYLRLKNKYENQDVSK